MAALSTQNVLERLEILRRKLEDEGLYVRANTVSVAIDEIKRLTDEAVGHSDMTVVDPDEWEPCSPSYLARGGSCGAPRVWNPTDRNHWHPKIDGTKK